MREKITWTNERRRLGDLIPWERNPRQITRDQARRLLDSFERFGQVETIAIGPGNEVYNGHQRLAVLMEQHGLDYEVEVRVASRALTESERERLTVYLHKGAAGEWDWDNLANGWDVDNLLEWGFGERELQIGGFDLVQPQGDDPGAKTDKADELREKWDVQPGQLWRLGEHRLICGDCTDVDTVRRLMGDQKVNLIVTDPPYGINYDGGFASKKRKKLQGDNDASLYEKFLAVTPIDTSCVLYMWYGFVAANTVYSAAINYGFEIRSEIIWHKLNAHYGAIMAHYKPKHEPCLYCVKNRAEFCGPTNEVTVWEYDMPTRNDFHPTQKPVELFERAIGNHPYKVVYDPFIGSGTTLVASERLSRVCRAIEIDPGYCAVTIQRWVDMTGGVPELLEAT